MILRVSSIHFFPFQKQGKRCRKKHLSKEAIRKIVLKQTMWRVYRRTGKEEDYANYKEALNAATTEIRQSKRIYEQKLACNIKTDSKIFMHMSGVNKTYKTRLDLYKTVLNIIYNITGVLMAEYLNGYFSQCLPKKILTHYQLLMLNFRGLNLTI